MNPKRQAYIYGDWGALYAPRAGNAKKSEQADESPNLFDQPTTHAKDTRGDSYRAIPASKLSAQQEIVLRAFELPTTDDEAARALGLPLTTVLARRNELVAKAKVIRCGEVKHIGTGRKRALWVALAKAEQMHSNCNAIAMQGFSEYEK